MDDPLNPKEVASEVERANANTWFDETFSMRVRDKKRGAIVVIMQRLHENDLTGHLLKKGGWTHLNVPAEAEKKTVLDFGRVTKTREAGEPLHPEREGLAEIARVKTELGSYAYAAQYQQNPAPLGGGVFQLGWFKRYSTIRSSKAGTPRRRPNRPTTRPSARGGASSRTATFCWTCS